MLITGKTKVKTALDTHPQLRKTLVNLSPKFRRLNNPLFFKTVARWATFNDVAKMGNMTICQILHTLNKELGQEDELIKRFPDCIEEKKLAREQKQDYSLSRFKKIEIFDTRTRDDFFLPEMVEKVKKLREGEALQTVSDFDPLPLKKMLDSMGYSYYTLEKSPELFETYIFVSAEMKEKKQAIRPSGKVPVVIQSATPVTFPIILRMLESKRIKKNFEIEELKVWRETEKHLGWIVNDKADISFTALMSTAKLFNKGKDIKMPAMVVWDNFKILTRGYVAKTFADLKGRKIHAPLFKSAPPAAVTKYLMKQQGHDPEEFEFVFGNPFGRPEQIKDCFVAGECDTVILREPEASFALFEAGDDAHTSIDYGELWQSIHPGSGNLPNAGLLFKGEFVRKHPDLATLFMEELKTAVQWVTENPREAADLSAAEMHTSAEEIAFFLSRATLAYRRSADVFNELQTYLKVLRSEEVIKIKDTQSLKKLFDWQDEPE